MGAVAVMHVLLFVMDMSMLGECEGNRVTSMLVCGTRCVCCERGACVCGSYTWFSFFRHARDECGTWDVSPSWCV